MVTAEERQDIVDEEHLRLLPIFYWVTGPLDLFISLYGLVYVWMGIIFALVPPEARNAPDTSVAFVGWFMVMIGLAFTVTAGASGVLKILTGFWIRARRHRVMCLVTAGLSCLSMPFGTMLGVLSLLVLLRPSVAARFESTAPRA